MLSLSIKEYGGSDFSILLFSRINKQPIQQPIPSTPISALGFKVFAGSILFGILTCVTYAAFKPFYLELIPVLLFAIFLFLFTRKDFRKNTKLKTGILYLSTGFFILFLCTYLYMELFDKEVGSLTFIGHLWRIGVMAGFSVFIGSILSLFIFLGSKSYR